MGEHNSVHKSYQPILHLFIIINFLRQCVYSLCSITSLKLLLSKSLMPSPQLKSNGQFSVLILLDLQTTAERVSSCLHSLNIFSPQLPAQHILQDLLLLLRILCRFLCLSPELPHWLSSKEYACSAGQVGSIPEYGRSPGEKGKATYFSNLAWRILWIVYFLRSQIVERD